MIVIKLNFHWPEKCHMAVPLAYVVTNHVLNQYNPFIELLKNRWLAYLTVIGILLLAVHMLAFGGIPVNRSIQHHVTVIIIKLSLTYYRSSTVLDNVIDCPWLSVSRSSSFFFIVIDCHWLVINFRLNVTCCHWNCCRWPVHVALHRFPALVSLGRSGWRRGEEARSSSSTSRPRP